MAAIPDTDRALDVWIRRLRPADRSGVWSSATARPGEAEVVLPVLRQYGLGGSRMTNEEARWVAVLGRAFPELRDPVHEAELVALARAYAQRVQEDKDYHDLDMMVSFRPWRDAAEAYIAELRKSATPWTRIPIWSTGSPAGKAIMGVWQEGLKREIADWEAAVERDPRAPATRRRTTSRTTYAPVRKGPLGSASVRETTV